MSDLPRSADAAYYASRTKLVFNQTKEGSRNRKPVPSYQHKAGDSAASSDKYYASQTAPPVIKKAETIVKGKTAVIDLAKLDSGVLPQTIKLFSAGHSTISVQGERTLLQNAKNAIDMAVGRNVLTRQQADRISFREVAVPVAEVEQKQENTEIEPVEMALRSMFAAAPVVTEPEQQPKKQGRKTKKASKLGKQTSKLDDTDDD